MPDATEHEPINPFDYVAPNVDSQARFDALSREFSSVYQAILTYCPGSAERTLAIRELQLVRFWANSAIVFNGRRYPL